jgi:Winged helix DNA-binding domain
MGAKRESAVAMKTKAAKESGYVARERQAQPSPQRLDRVIHDRTRLAIVAALAATELLSFTDLKAVTGTTDGNLSVHARRLEDAVREDIRRPHPADGIPAERSRAAGVRKVSRPHGRAHQGGTQEIDRRRAT